MDVELGLDGESRIGDYLTVTLNQKVDSFHRFHKYSCEDNSGEWSSWSMFVTVPEDESVKPTDEVEAWIFDIDHSKSEITVTTDSFGRSDLYSLRDRHKEAADHIARLSLMGVDQVSDVDPEKVSHAKGLLSRCLRKDQWDWLTVYRLLGYPPKGLLGFGQSTLSNLRQAVTSGDIEGVQNCLDKLRDSGLAKRFAIFVRKLNQGQGEELTTIDDEYLLKKLHRLDAEEFEYFISDIFGQLGWDTEVVPVEEDQGADVRATRKKPPRVQMQIQVKRRHPSQQHSVKELQRYAGLTSRKGVDNVLFITTGRITEHARREVEMAEYDLMDGSDLADFIRDNREDIGPVVVDYLDLN